MMKHGEMAYSSLGGRKRSTMNEPILRSQPSGESLMHTLKRIVGAICALLSTIVFLAFVGGIVGIWLVREPLTAKSDRILGRIEDTLRLVTHGLTDLGNALRKAEDNLHQYQKGAAKSDGNPQNDAVLKLVAWQLKSQVAPDIGKARETLIGVSEASVVLNSLLDDVNECPTVQFDRLDPEQLHRVTHTLSRVTTSAQDLSRLLEEGKMTDSQEAATRMEEGLQRVRDAVGGFDSRLTEIKTRVTDLKAQLPRRIDIGVVVLTAVFVWLALSQISLLMHGWAWLRAPAATAK
jgi:hypothetical protein